MSIQARDKRNAFENEIGVWVIIGQVGSGKSLFITSQILEGLARGSFDLVITNMNFKLELLSNPAEWKRLSEEYTLQHFPPKWQRQEYHDGFWDAVTVKRTDVIARQKRMIDSTCERIKPAQFVHLDTEEISSTRIKAVIEQKARELGLIDSDGKLLIRVWLVLDEAFSLVEARRSGVSEVIDLSEFALQSRHYGVKIWLISPLIEALDVRYRELCTRLFMMERKNRGLFAISQVKMHRGNVISPPRRVEMFASSVVPVYMFYNSWAPPITTLVELEREAKEAQEEKHDAERQEYTCEICGKTVLGQSNFRAHQLSHTGSPLPSEREVRDIVVERISDYLASHPDAGPTEIANALGLPRTTVQSGLERMRRKRMEEEGQHE